MARARAALEDVLRRLTAAAEAERVVHEATAPVEHRSLCVAMATYDDFDGVWFTVQSVLLHHREVRDRINFLILDNHPRGESAAALKALDGQVPQLRYVPFDGYEGTAVRDLLFREADADVVCCVDAHVLLAPGALAALLDHFDRDPASRDLVQGPLVSAGGSRLEATHMRPEWSGLMYGRWAADRPAFERGTPFEIELHGLGLFACRTSAWPGLNPRFRGFGGEEGYVHEKVRRGGGRVLCHPAVAWSHRFTRVGGTPYTARLRDRLRNYRIAWDELGWDAADVERHFRAHCHDSPAVNDAIAAVQRDLRDPFARCDAVLVPARPDREWDRVVAALDRIHVAWRAERVDVDPDPDEASDGTTRVGRQRAVDLAHRRGYRHVVVIDADAELADDIAGAMADAWAGGDVGAGVVALDGGDGASRVHLVHRRAFTTWPADAAVTPLETTTPPVQASRAMTVPRLSSQPSLPAGASRRAVVAVLLPRDHLPFIRHWCRHHLAQGWQVHLLDNTGSVGATRQTSHERRDLVAARSGPPAHHAHTAHLSDEEMSAALADAVADLPVVVTPWRPRAADGAIVHGQAEAYARFIEAYRTCIDWAIFIDADEYLAVGPGCDWDDLIDRAAAAECPRIVLDAVQYESRWTLDGQPRPVDELRPSAIQDGGSKNLVRLAEVTRADLHWSWQLGSNRRIARPDRMAYGFRHHRADPMPPALHLRDQVLATWIDESVPVEPLR